MKTERESSLCPFFVPYCKKTIWATARIRRTFLSSGILGSAAISEGRIRLNFFDRSARSVGQHRSFLCRSSYYPQVLHGNRSTE